MDTGSRMDDMIYEEFKGTGNLEIHLDRNLQERRVFPALDLYRSGTRREEKLLSPKELEGIWSVRKLLSGKQENATELLIDMMSKTQTNDDFLTKLNDWLRLMEKQGYQMVNNNCYNVALFHIGKGDYYHFNKNAKSDPRPANKLTIPLITAAITSLLLL